MINCKSAEFLCIGELKDHQVAFTGTVSTNWGGYPATIIKSSGQSVWGAIWRVTDEDVNALDIQEGVHIGVYSRVELDIDTAAKGVVRCFSYAKPPHEMEGLPSHTYLKVIVVGAKQCGLPLEYIKKLESIQHNGHSARDEKLNGLV